MWIGTVRVFLNFPLQVDPNVPYICLNAGLKVFNVTSNLAKHENPEEKLITLSYARNERIAIKYFDMSKTFEFKV